MAQPKGDSTRSEENLTSSLSDYNTAKNCFNKDPSYKLFTEKDSLKGTPVYHIINSSFVEESFLKGIMNLKSISSNHLTYKLCLLCHQWVPSRKVKKLIGLKIGGQDILCLLSDYCGRDTKDSKALKKNILKLYEDLHKNDFKILFRPDINVFQADQPIRENLTDIKLEIPRMAEEDGHTHECINRLKDILTSSSSEISHLSNTDVFNLKHGLKITRPLA